MDLCSLCFAASSSPRRRQLVNSLPLGGTFALRHHPVFQSMKSRGSLARNARFGAPKSQNVRSFSCFAWQAQYFGSVSMQSCRFFVAGAALCDVAFRDVVAGAAFCDLAKVLFPRIAMAVTSKRDTTAMISWQAQDLVIVLKIGGSFAKVILFELCENGFIRKTRTKSSIFELKVCNLKEVSHEMFVLTLQTFKVRGHFRVLRGRRTTLEASAFKSCGSIARNARFGSFSFEKLRKHRTKCSFWKLLLRKVQGHRTKCSFWNLVLWKVEEVSHEMLVLEACSLKSRGSLARNARFGSFCSTE